MWALTFKVFGTNFAKNRAPGHHKTNEISGVVKQKDPTPNSRKWEVLWENGQTVAVSPAFFLRVQQPGQAAAGGSAAGAAAAAEPQPAPDAESESDHERPGRTDELVEQNDSEEEAPGEEEGEDWLEGVTVGELTWTEVASITVDPRPELPPTQILWPTASQQHRRKSRMSYFIHFFPSVIADVVTRTNTKLTAANKKKLSTHELLKWMGMVLTIRLHKTGGTRRSLWSSKRGLFPGLELG